MGAITLITVSKDFHDSSVGEEPTHNLGDLGSVPGLERSPEKGKSTHSIILAWRIPWI